MKTGLKERVSGKLEDRCSVFQYFLISISGLTFINYCYALTETEYELATVNSNIDGR